MTGISKEECLAIVMQGDVSVAAGAAFLACVKCVGPFASLRSERLFFHSTKKQELAWKAECFAIIKM